MIKKIKDKYERLRTNFFIKNDKSLNTSMPDFLMSHDHLSKYKPKLKQLFQEHNELYYDYKNKTDKEHQFARLILLRNNDLAKGVLLNIGYNNTHAVFPLMRALCDNLFLLKYVDKNPSYILKFMNKDGRGVNVTEIKRDLNETQLNEYYSFLSEMFHANPSSIKLSYYESKDTQNQLIMSMPHNYPDLFESSIISLISILSNSNYLIKKIYEKNWRPDGYRPLKQNE